MTTFQDWSVGIGKEAAYGTVVAPSRFLEFTDPKPFAPDLGIVQGEGIRPGSRVARSARRVTTLRKASGAINVELVSKGLGLLFEACLGAGKSSVVSGAVYQQLFTIADDLPSHTVQFGAANADGTISPVTFPGSVVSSWELGGDVGKIATLQTTWDARDCVTSAAYATPTYPAGGNLFLVQDAAIVTGMLVAPTDIALASAPTAIAGIKSFKVSGDNGLIADRYFASAGGLKAKPRPGTRAIKVEFETEYGTNTLRDAWLAQTPMALVATLSAGALASGLETVQIVIPELKLDGNLPEAAANQIASQSITATVLDNLTAGQPIWIVVRTTDTAL